MPGILEKKRFHLGGGRGSQKVAINLQQIFKREKAVDKPLRGASSQDPRMGKRVGRRGEAKNLKGGKFMRTPQKKPVKGPLGKK